jgi:hypothetical protein
LEEAAKTGALAKAGPHTGNSAPYRVLQAGSAGG